MEQAKTSKDAASPVVIKPPAEQAQRVRDFLFYGGLLPVTAALGLALHLHLDLEPLIASAIVLPTAVCLLLAHKLQRRSQSMRQLESELAELRRVSPALRLGREARPDAATPAVPVRPVVGAHSSPGAMPGPASRMSAPAAPGNATGAGIAPRTAAPASAGSSASMGSPAPGAREQQAMASTPPGSVRPGSQTSTAPNAATKPRADLVPSLSTGSAMPLPVATQLPAASGAEVADALMGTYWGHRPGMHPEPVLTSPVTAFAAQLSSQKRGADAVARRPASAADPTTPAGNIGPGPDERELETMQNLIQQLAVQLNAPKEAEPAVEKASNDKPAIEKGISAPPVLERFPASETAAATTERGLTEAVMPASDMTTPAIATPAITTPTRDTAHIAPSLESTDADVSQSVAALRATASTMRQPPDVRPQAPVGGSADASTPELGRSPATPPPLPPASRYGELARVAEAVAADRIDVYLDPILGLVDRKARLFEVSVRVLSSDGCVLDPAAIREIASGTGLLARIDAAKLARSAWVAGRLKARGTNASLYSNLASESLADDVFLDTFEDAIATEADLPRRLVLSFSQADVRAFNDVHWETVATMADIGLRFALEDVADLDMDFEKLKANGFEFVKLDAPVFLEGLPAADGAIPAADLCRHLSGLGLSLIVGAIEDEMSLAKVLGFGVLFGQGTIFGGPRAVQVDTQQQNAAA